MDDIMQNIFIIPSHQINFTKWDKCISQSSNNILYAHSFYLNAICDNWSGLIINDYDAVLPIPWRKKFGITYCYTPAFIQQLGLFGNTKILNEEITHTIKKHFRFGDMMLNFENKISSTEEINSLTNLIIDLSIGYDSIHANYKKDATLNIKKAEKENLHYSDSNEIEYIIQLYQSHYQDRTKHTTAKDYSNFAKLATELSKQQKCFARIAKNNEQIVAAVLLLSDDQRIYNIMNIVTDEGRNKEANYFLMNNIIKEFAGKNLLFDLEGSDLSGVKSFYEKFGATNQPYFHWHFNELPWYVKLFKQ